MWRRRRPVPGRRETSPIDLDVDPDADPGAGLAVDEKGVPVAGSARAGEVAVARPSAARREWQAAVVIAVGGVIGAEGRYAVEQALPHRDGGFPWSTVVANVSGCLLIGALMVVLVELTSPHRLVRPLLGVGILGGYTTFSTFSVDVERLILGGDLATALGYLATTVVACAGAVWVSTVGTQLVNRLVSVRRSRQYERAHRTRRTR